jgi:hypothetical protein
LLLVTILLVLVAAVTLLIGIFSDNLALIFVSIGASALAAIVLAVLSQVSRRKDRAATSGATAPEPLAKREDVPARAAESIAATGEPVVRAEVAPTETLAAVPAATSSAPEAAAPADLPIANYASLRVNEILPKLDALDLDELEAVAQYEETNKNRTTVLNRIDALMDELEAAEAGGTTTTTAAAAAPATASSASATDDAVVEAAVESIEEIGEPVVALTAPTSSTTTAGGDFPIADYDSLSEDELIARLQDLDADQLEAVADREEAGPNRDAVLDAIDDRLDILEGIVPAPAAASAAPAPAPAPARKAPAKKATAAKKTAAKKQA